MPSVHLPNEFQVVECTILFAETTILFVIEDERDVVQYCIFECQMERLDDGLEGRDVQPMYQCNVLLLNSSVVVYNGVQPSVFVHCDVTWECVVLEGVEVVVHADGHCGERQARSVFVYLCLDVCPGEKKGKCGN